MKILLISSEVAPFAKTGGLADVAGSLPKALLLQGNDVRVVLPRYRNISGVDTLGDFPVQVGNRKTTCIVRTSSIEAKSEDGVRHLPVYFLDNYHYFDRDGYYGYRDEAERFSSSTGRCSTCVSTWISSPMWSTATTGSQGSFPAYQGTGRRQPPWKDVATCYTIHNLRYQGISQRSTDLLGVPDAISIPRG